jgi:hypothetical protein
MTVTVDIDLGYEFTVKAAHKDVFDLLSDVPKSVSHFPKVHALTDMGGGAYRWEMEKVGTAQVNIQTIYASKYVSDRKKGTVVWTPSRAKAMPWWAAAGRSPKARRAPTWPSRSRARWMCRCPV